MAPSHEEFACAGVEQTVPQVMNFEVPFTLSLTVTTAVNHSGDGGIFASRGNGFTRIVIDWRDTAEGSTINLQLGQTGDCSVDQSSCLVDLASHPAKKGQTYVVQVSWDHATASWSVDGATIKAWPTHTGFGEDTPKLCYAFTGGADGGWVGTIGGITYVRMT
jgi:hypothetical protein